MRTKRNWLLINEKFLTHQGEANSAGQLAYFIRLGACNLHCGFCDSASTWSFGDKAKYSEFGITYNPKEELHRSRITDIANEIPGNVSLVVITGGEPLLQLDSVSDLISLLNEESKHRFEIETAGTLAPGELRMYENLKFNVSPKLASSGNRINERFKPDVLDKLLAMANCFKFVVSSKRGMTDELRADINEVGTIVKTVGIPNDKVWLMPVGITEREVIEGLQVLTPVALDLGYNITSRQHILTYGNKRGT